MNALDILHYGDRDLRAGFADVRSEEWDRPGVTTRWTPRDTLAHLVSYELLVLAALDFVQGNTDQPLLEAMGRGSARFNDDQVAARRDRTPGALLEEYALAYDRVVAAARALGPDRLRAVGTIPWYGAEYSLDDFIVYAGYAHKREHLGQLRQHLLRIRGASTETTQ